MRLNCSVRIYHNGCQHPRVDHTDEKFLRNFDRVQSQVQAKTRGAFKRLCFTTIIVSTHCVHLSNVQLTARIQLQHCPICIYIVRVSLLHAGKMLMPFMICEEQFIALQYINIQLDFCIYEWQSMQFVQNNVRITRYSSGHCFGYLW